MEIQVITVTVSNLEKSKLFYEEILGFIQDCYYEPTRWISFKFESSAFIAIQEKSNFRRIDSEDEIDFLCDNVEKYWNSINDKVEVVHELKKTDWGSFKFVIKDLDGYRLGFVQK
jgi:catechol 2,3-dioxygenase-like lactoylglutathione lyase family enzyme